MLSRTPGGVEVALKSGAPERTVGYAGFPIWSGNRLLHVPLCVHERRGARWFAAGELETRSGRWRVEDLISCQGNTVRIDRTWRFKGGLESNVRFGMDLFVPFGKLDFWAIPFVSMNGNAGSGTVPSGMTRDGTPWTFREERTTAPGLMTLEEGAEVAGTYTEPGRTEREICACTILPQDGGYILRTFFPFKEGPRTFLGTAHPGNSKFPEQGLYAGVSGGHNGFRIEGTARFRRTFYAVLDAAGETRHGYVRVWESAWRHLKEAPPPPVSLKETEASLWKSLESFWFSKGRVRGYVVRIGRDGNLHGGFSPRLGAGWCGPTMMLAWLGLRRARKTGDGRLARRPLQAAEFFVKEAGRDSGVFLTHYDVNEMRWIEKDLNAVQMGGACYWLLRCVREMEAARTPGRKATAAAWKAFALRFCQLALRTQRADGAFASHWTPDGASAGYERTMGLHAARAVLGAFQATGAKRYLQAAERAAEYYIRRCVDREAGYGDCTDILNSTTENDGAGVPDFYLDLCRLTGNKRYLEKAVRAAEYCLAFMFAYNVYFPPETECGRRGMRTRGFPAISPETGFVCFWFVHQANAFLELWRETGQARWKEYAVTLIRATLQMRAEPGDLFGLHPRLAGARAEVIPVTDTVKGGFVWKKGMTGYAWHQPVWWPAAFNLQNFAVLEDRFPEVLKEIEK